MGQSKEFDFHSPPSKIIQNNLRIKSTAFYVLFFLVFLPLFFLLLSKVFQPYAKRVMLPSSTAFKITGVGLIFAGIWLVLFSIWYFFKKGRGWPVSSAPPKQLVQDGPYRFSRHPIYFGGFLIFEGLSIILELTAGVLVGGPLFLMSFAWYASQLEEPFLIQKYGENYIRYKHQTPMFFSYPFRKKIHKVIHFVFNKLEYFVNHPVIWQKGNHILYVSYGLFCATGITLGLTLFSALLIGNGFSKATTIGAVLVMTFFNLIGIRLVWLVGSKWYTGEKWKDIFGKVGFVSWGVPLGTMLAAILCAQYTNTSWWLWMDFALFSQMVTHVFGRVGCLTYGCCYGKPALGSIRIEFRNPVLKCNREHLITNHRLFPVQAFSAFHGVMILAIVGYLWWNQNLPYSVPFVMTGLFYTILRFYEEMARFQKKLFFAFFSAAQLLCLLFWILGLYWLMHISGVKTVQHHLPLKILADFSFFDVSWMILLLFIWFMSFFIFSYHHGEIGKWT